MHPSSTFRPCFLPLSFVYVACGKDAVSTLLHRKFPVSPEPLTGRLIFAHHMAVNAWIYSRGSSFPIGRWGFYLFVLFLFYFMLVACCLALQYICSIFWRQYDISDAIL